MSLVGVGTHQMWGLSSAFDCLEAVREIVAPGDPATAKEVDPIGPGGEDDPINILLVGSADIRHVLKTIAQRRRHDYGKRPIHFYLHDQPDEVLARQLLLLQMTQDFDVPIRTRGNTWLEVFGNALVQDRTSKYIEEKGKELVNLICDRKGKLKDIVDVSLLKFRDVDSLQEIFQGWSHRAPYDVTTLREFRLRHLYGERYDFRKNVLDWDYQMMVKPVCGNIHILHFRGWRQTGVAFEFGDQTYTVPNRSMATYAEGRERGLTKLRLGFWLDIVNSPYWALGTAASITKELDEQLLRLDNVGTGTEQWRHTAVEMSVFNILAYLHEIETGTPYTMRVKNAVYSGLGGFDEEKPVEAEAEAPTKEDGVEAEGAAEAKKGVEVEELEDGEPEAKGSEESKGSDADASGEGEGDALVPGVHTPSPEVLEERQRQKQRQAEARAASLAAKRREQAIKRAKCIVESYAGIKVFPLGGKFTDILHKKRFRKRFHMAFFSNHAAQHMGDEKMGNVLRDRAVVVMELARAMVTLKLEQQNAFKDKVNDLCRGAGCYFLGSDTAVFSDKYSLGSAVGMTTNGQSPAELRKKLASSRRPELSVYVWESAKAEERKASWVRVQAMAERGRKAREEEAAAATESKGVEESKGSDVSAAAADAAEPEAGAGESESKGSDDAAPVATADAAASSSADVARTSSEIAMVD